MEEGLRPRLAAWLEAYNRKLELAGGAGPVEAQAVRDGLARLTRALVTKTVPVPLVADAVVAAGAAEVAVRIFHPEPHSRLPLAVYLHGGGHVAGSVAVFDPLCRRIARAARRVVIAVDYRLAPEHPYPAALEDAAAACAGCREVLARLGLPSHDLIALIGDSAGGALAASLVHRGLVPEVERLALIYPLLDYGLAHPSLERFASGYLIEKRRMQWSLERYFQNGEDRRQASPLHMEVPGGFPPTFLAVAGFCPLQDEAMAYGERLRRHGVAVACHRFPAVVHAFLHLEDLVDEDCHRLYRLLGDFLRS